MIPMTQKWPSPDDRLIVDDDLADHLSLLRAEFAQTVEQMEAINATSAAAAYFRAWRACVRFHTTAAAFQSDGG